MNNIVMILRKHLEKRYSCTYSYTRISLNLSQDRHKRSEYVYEYGVENYGRDQS